MGDHVTFIVTQPNSFKPHPLLPPPPHSQGDKQGPLPQGFHL